MSLLLEFGLITAGLYLAAWVARRAAMPTVVGFLALGLLFGPSGVVRVYAPGPLVNLLGEVGLLLLLFFMGLEFSLRRFVEGGRATLRAGSIDLIHIPVGVGVGMALGLGWLGSAFLGAALYVSSSGVIARLLTERDLVAYPEAERTLGVLVFEDLAMVLVLAGLGVASGGGGVRDLLGVGAFVAAFVVVLRFGRPLLTRLFDREGEALVLLGLATLLLVAAAAHGLHFPEAVAAFLLGMAAGETPSHQRLAAALRPWYDVAAAVFFLDFALDVNVGAALDQLPAALLLVAVTVVTQALLGFVAGRATGLSARASVGHAVMLLPRGEFSLVILGLAAASPVLDAAVQDDLHGMVSLYVVLMVVLGGVAYRRFDVITRRLGRLADPRSARPADAEAAERRRAMEEMTLD